MYTKQQIIEEIKSIAIKLGVKSLKRKEFSRNSRISTGSVRYHFGTWNNAIKEAGLTPIDSKDILSFHRKTINDEDLLLDLIHLYNQFGKEPTEDLINSKGKYSVRPSGLRDVSKRDTFS